MITSIQYKPWDCRCGLTRRRTLHKRYSISVQIGHWKLHHILVWGTEGLHANSLQSLQKHRDQRDFLQRHGLGSHHPIYQTAEQVFVVLGKDVVHPHFLVNTKYLHSQTSSEFHSTVCLTPHQALVWKIIKNLPPPVNTARLDWWVATFSAHTLGQ